MAATTDPRNFIWQGANARRNQAARAVARIVQDQLLDHQGVGPLFNPDDLGHRAMYLRECVVYRRAAGWFVFGEDAESDDPDLTPRRSEPSTPRYR